MAKQECEKGKIPKMLAILANHFNLDPKFMKAVLVKEFPEIMDKTKCANCGASMISYLPSIDALDTLLVQGMADEVRKRLEAGMSFTEANQVHVQSTLNQYYSVPSRTTQCAKLGLIAKVPKRDKEGKALPGTHDRRAGWLITRRGFSYLAGEQVPAYVRVFRNKIIDRGDMMTTIHHVLDDDKKKRNDIMAEAKRNLERKDYQELYGVALGDPVQGKLL